MIWNPVLDWIKTINLAEFKLKFTATNPFHLALQLVINCPNIGKKNLEKGLSQKIAFQLCASPFQIGTVIDSDPGTFLIRYIGIFRSLA